MTAHSRRPIEVFSSKRRASTASSTGLDYPSNHRVEEDILFRIRSLLLSRNGRCPPRTPHTSEEDRNRHSRYCHTSDTSDRFDFSTAKSVTRLLVRTESGGLAFPVTHLRSRIATSRMDVARRPTQPSISIKKRSLRATSSNNDLSASLDDAAIHAALLPCCPPCPPEDAKKTFRLPRLVLREKSVKRKRDTNFRSCIDFTSRSPPANDALRQKPDIPCCPPPSSRPATSPTKESDLPQLLSGKTVKAEPADLACFLAGCGPGECKTHRRGSLQLLSPKEKNGIRAVDKGIADDMAKPGLTVMAVKQTFGAAHHIRPDTKETSQSQSEETPSSHSLVPQSSKFSRRRPNGSAIEQNRPDLVNNSAPLRSPTSSVLSLDAFPHVVQSQEMAAKVASTQFLSSVVVTNFSLPSPKVKSTHTIDVSQPKHAKSSIASLPRVAESISAKNSNTSMERFTDSVRPKKSDASLRTKPIPPSLHSVASQATSIHHSFFNPSVSAAEPVDTGLPIPPVLVQVSVSSLEAVVADGKGLNDSAKEPPQSLKALGVDSSSATEVVGHLTSLKKAKGSAGRIKDRTNETTDDTKDEPGRKESHTRTVQGPALVSEAPEAVGNLTSLKKAKNLADRIKDRTSEAIEGRKEEIVEALEPSSPPTSKPDKNVGTSVEPMLKSMTSLKGLLGYPEAQHLENISGVHSTKPEWCSDPVMKYPQNASGVDPEKGTCCPGLVTHTPQKRSLVDPVNAAYWGFVPAVKEAVQEAVQVAVRKAVQEVIVPPGVQQDEASEAYRKLVGDSLAEAAKDVDSYLRKASLWNESPSSIRDRSEDSLELGESMAADQEPLMAGAVLEGESSPGPNYKRSDPALTTSLKQAKAVARNLTENCRSKRNSTENYGRVGNVPAGFESRENFIPSEFTSPDNLETVPLETVDERLVENHKQGGKISGAWNGLGKKRSSGYTAIPTRSSSKNRVPGSKYPTTPDSSVKESAKGSRLQRRSMEQLKWKPAGGLRSVFSVGSLKSFESGDRDQEGEQESTVQELTDANTDRSSVTNKRSTGRLGHRNTIHWLRELLSTNGLYEPKLTALPPRTRRDEHLSTGRIRSQTAPTKPVTELYLGATVGAAGDGDAIISIPENGNQQTAAMTQAFTKTINDLEFLLNEALFIARQAADREDMGYAPILLGRAAAVLKGGRNGCDDATVRRKILEARSRPHRYRQKRSDNVSSIASMHESFGSFSSSDSQGSDEVKERAKPCQLPIPELRLKVPTVGIVAPAELTQMTHHDAGWPPTGRVPTPFPPGSIAPSPMEFKDEMSRRETHALVATTVTTSNGRTGSLGQSASPDTELPSVQIKDFNPFLTENVGNARKISQVSPTKRSRSTTGRRSRQTSSCVTKDLDLAQSNPEAPPEPLPMPPITPRGASLTKAGKRRATQTDPQLIRANFPIESVPSKQEVREYIRAFHHPPIQPRASSLNLRKQAEKDQAQSQGVGPVPTGHSYSWQSINRHAIEKCSQEEDIPDPAQTGGFAMPDHDHDHATSISKSFDGSQSEAIHFDTGFAHRQHGGQGAINSGGRGAVELRDNPSPNLPQVSQRGGKGSHLFNLEGRNHISLRGEHHKGFSFARTHKKPKIARDWAPVRKRFVAVVACISTALVGMLVGVYAAEVPAIQYWIVDFHHYTILGNVFFFIGLSIPTFFFWPLPLLHGRKPYTLGAMSLAMPLLFPQALAVGQFRSPYVDYWRVGLILPRALMGFVLGFANMNFKATLLDLFGASLQSENPHQEVVDENDVRRHGGGLGVWLGIWTWCTMGSISVGFLIGAIIINHANPAWGFYISIAIIAGVLLLNVICPEVRRSAFRRSVAEMKYEDGISRRLGRGEVKMHMVQTGPRWWGEEFHYGVMLNAKMLRQPGFMVLAVYVSWIYGQTVLLVVVSINSTRLGDG